MVDVRTVPRSRTNPQYNADTLPDALGERQVAYTRIAELGGLRSRAREVPSDVNGFWQNQSFHNYADHALSEAFAVGLGQLQGLSNAKRTAMMCSEAVWWRCHRRIIADYLLLRGRDVFHLMGTNKVEAARMTPAAEERDGHLVYPPPGVYC